MVRDGNLRDQQQDGHAPEQERGARCGKSGATALIACLRGAVRVRRQNGRAQHGYRHNGGRPNR